MLADFLIIGGGIIGISIARELKKLYPNERVVLLEKEKTCGLHASGRNSGVLHAGFYYSPDSLKAQFTRLGNKSLTEYCDKKGIPINKCGKLVVAKDADDLPALHELLMRGLANGVELQELTEKEAKEIEPRVRTYERALFSPNTATVDPVAVVNAMKEDAIQEGIQVLCGVQYLSKQESTIQTSSDHCQAGYIVNAAGLYADKIAKDFGFSDRYRILPFKGLYLYSSEAVNAIRTNVYPVPDLRNPFLGVHFTVTATGQIKIGPTAVPAFWRENYHGLQNFNLREFIEIIVRACGLMALSNFDFKRLAVREVRKCLRAKMVSLAGALVDGVRAEHYRRWGRPGIRAQLVDVKKRKLEMDFVIEGDHKSMHILNAVSPAFTCSIPFSQYVCKQIQNSLS
jgi:L-2-hydroxyglutarate oxidase